MKITLENKNKYEGFKVTTLEYAGEDVLCKFDDTVGRKSYVCPECLYLGRTCPKCSDK